MPRLPSQLTYNDLNGAEATEVLVDWFRQLLQSQPLFQPHLTIPMAKMTLDIGLGIEMHIGGTVPTPSAPEQLFINGTVSLDNRTDTLSSSTRLSTVVNAAPTPGGVPPDQIREQHNLPVPRPAYGARETGSHLFLADIIENTQNIQKSDTGGRQGEVAEGYVFSPQTAPVGKQAAVAGAVEQHIPVDNGGIDIDLTGAGKMRQGDMIVTAGTHKASVKEVGDGKGAKYGSVSGTYDAGPAGLGRNAHGSGLYGDGRSRLSFGNANRR